MHPEGLENGKLGVGHIQVGQVHSHASQGQELSVSMNLRHRV
jgi:hypothetical protein